MKYQQRDIIEVNFELPNGLFKPHPALIISQEEIFNAEDIYYIVMLSTKQHYPDFLFEITPDMLNYTQPNSPKSFVCCHLLNDVEEYEINQRFGSVKKKLSSKYNKKS